MPYRDHNILDGKNYADKLVVNKYLFNLANVSLCNLLKSLGEYLGSLGTSSHPVIILKRCNE